MKKTSLAILVLVTAVFTLAGPVENMSAGSWYEVPDSHMRQVHSGTTEGGLWDVTCVIDCWCGAAFDTKRNRLIVWGGGHAQYGGNELYAFDVDDLSWERLTDASPLDQDGDAFYPDGRPSSPHSYNYLQYMPATDMFYSFGLAVMYPNVSNSPITFTFSFETLEWGQKANCLSGSYGLAFSAVDVETGFAWLHAGQSSARLSMYNPYTDVWIHRNGMWQGFDGNGFEVTAAIDPKNGVMVSVGDGQMWSWNVRASGNIPGVQLGGGGVSSSYAPGFAYDPVSERFIGWSGGKTIYLTAS